MLVGNRYRPNILVSLDSGASSKDLFVTCSCCYDVTVTVTVTVKANVNLSLIVNCKTVKLKYLLSYLQSHQNCMHINVSSYRYRYLLQFNSCAFSFIIHRIFLITFAVASKLYAWIQFYSLCLHFTLVRVNRTFSFALLKRV